MNRFASSTLFSDCSLLTCRKTAEFSAQEMAPQVKYFLSRRENLSVGLQHPHK